jgi:hypothetical protein
LPHSPSFSPGSDRRSSRKALVLVSLIGCAAVAVAQPVSRVATTVSGLAGSAQFYHGKSIVLETETVTENGLTRIAVSPRPMYVLWKDRPASGKGEIRGEFWDVGRIEQGDSRFTGIDFSLILEHATRGRWPRRDEVYVILAASMLPATPSTAPTLRGIALAPDRYEGREVRVSGRFKGRNLYGELPQALGKTKWDFVLQSAEGAVWVTGMRPKGKGFDLDPGARVDTGRWLEVTGVVSMIGTMPYITASALQPATAPETVVEIAVPQRPQQPAPEVIFSAPVQDDHDVERTARVRVQFSRDIDPKSVEGRVKVAYLPGPGGAAPPPPPAFTVTYNDKAHAIEIRFTQPLERFQQVKVDLLEGVMSLDNQVVKPWTLTFSTGGT